MVAAQHDRVRVSRRQVLLGAAAVSAGVTAGCGGGGVPRQRDGADATPVSPPAVSAAPPSVSPTPPAAVAVLAKPVFTLAEFRRVVPGPAFPADAVALTIDDGPHPVWTPKILSLLERYHVPATFCLIGNQVRGHESVARSVAAAGHHIANHTYTHPSRLPKLAPAKMREEIHRAQDKIYSATGQTPTLFRSPGGSWSAPLMGQIAQAGLVPVDWSDDPNDWRRPGAGVIASKLLAARPGHILLCHDGGGDRSQTYEALKTVIPALLARGYTFVAL